MLHFRHMILVGMGLVFFGLLIRYQVGKRRFNRRSITGMELFSTYGKGIVTKILEGFANLLGRLLILLGIALIFAASI